MSLLQKAIDALRIIRNQYTGPDYNHEQALEFVRGHANQALEQILAFTNGEDALSQIDARFDALNSLLDAAGLLEDEARAKAVYELRLFIATAMGDRERIKAAQKSLDKLSVDPEAHEIASRLVAGEYFISRLVTSKYMTYRLEGEEVLFGAELQRKVEALLGVKLEQFTHPEFKMEIGLRIPGADLASASENLLQIG